MVFDNTTTDLHKFITLTIETNIQQFLFDDFDQNEEDGSNVFGTRENYIEIALEYINDTMNEYNKYKLL